MNGQDTRALLPSRAAGNSFPFHYIYPMDQKEQKLGDLIRSYTRDATVREKLYQKKIESSWEKLFGQTVQEYTRKIRLRDGILTLYLDSSALRNEMHLARENVMAIVNGELREEYVQQIIIKP